MKSFTVQVTVTCCYDCPHLSETDMTCDEIYYGYMDRFYAGISDGSKIPDNCPLTPKED